MQVGDDRSRIRLFALVLGTTAGVVGAGVLIFSAGAFGFFAAAGLLIATVGVVRRFARPRS